MGNQKINNPQQREHLSEEQKLKREKFLLTMKQEINELECNIKEVKSKNIKIKRIRNLKIMLKTMQRIAPYSISFVLVVGGLSFLGYTPFVLDEHKENLKMMETFDSNGNVSYEQQFEKYQDSQSTISYFENWKYEEGDLYSRKIQIYRIDDIDKETIMKLMNEYDINSLEEIFGDPISQKTEAKNHLTKEELEANSYLQVVMYSELEDQYIMVKESIVQEVDFVLIDLFTIMVLWVLIASWREVKKTDFSKCIEKIKNEYQMLLDEEMLIKKLEIKKNNYNRLTR